MSWLFAGVSAFVVALTIAAVVRKIRLDRAAAKREQLKRSHPH